MDKNILEVLKQAEKETQCSFIWDRVGPNEIQISTVGYRMIEHKEIEAKLIKLGCRYYFAKDGYSCIQDWDKMSGRTFTILSEPK